MIARFGSWATLALLLSAAPAAVRADDWNSLGLSAARGRVSQERSGPGFGAQEWRHRLDEVQLAYRTLPASPSVADGFVVFATPRHLVRALSEIDGRLLWQASAGDGNISSPAIWRGLVLVLGTDRTLSALRLADGTAAWTTDLGGIGYASPVVVDDSVYVAVGNPARSVLRIDAATGQIRWRAGEGVFKQSPFASVAVAGGHVIAGELGGLYHSFAVADGRREWTFDTGGEIYLSSALVAGDRAYLLTGGNKVRLHAVQLSSGAAVEGWPLDVAIPEEGAGTGQLLLREHTVSSCAGGADLLTFSVRADDRMDGNGDGQAETFVLRQFLFAVQPESRRIVWSAANGRLETRDESVFPRDGVIGTPVMYQWVGGEPMLAITSSVAPRLRVLDARSGAIRWSVGLAGPARSSPVLANGRLVVTTDAGVVHSFLSNANFPPVAPVLGLSPADGQQSDAAATVLRWGAAVDREGASLSYEVRVDDDGEILRDWDFQAMTSSLQQVVRRLSAGASYVYAIRARDSLGAYSAWTDPQSFRPIASPEVLVNEVPAAGLIDALAGAQPGTIIRLGAGVFKLSGTLQLPPGTSLVGQAPHLTTLDAGGLAVGVSASSGSALRQLTVSGARVGVAVDAADDVRLSNVILRDNDEIGLRVGPTGTAELVSATVVRNGTGVLAAGATAVRNTLVTRNDVGLAATAPELLSSSYDNVQDNRQDDYRGITRGGTDLSLSVSFESPDATDVRLRSAQGTTDKGDPADEYGQEPQPNGGRINIGAFGNTAFAELSAELPGAGGPAQPGTPLTPPAPEQPGARSVAGGGGCALAAPGTEGAPGGLALVLVALMLVLRRRR